MQEYRTNPIQEQRSSKYCYNYAAEKGTFITRAIQPIIPPIEQSLEWPMIIEGTKATAQLIGGTQTTKVSTASSIEQIRVIWEGLIAPTTKDHFGKESIQ